MSGAVLIAVDGNVNERTRITAISVTESVIAYLSNALRNSDLFQIYAACESRIANLSNAVLYVHFFKRSRAGESFFADCYYARGHGDLLNGAVSAVQRAENSGADSRNGLAVYLTGDNKLFCIAGVGSYSDCSVFILIIGIIFRGVGYRIIDYNKCREIIIVSYLIIFVSSISIVARDICYAEIVLISLFQQFAV